MRICKILLLIIFCLSTGYSQDLEKENQYNTVPKDNFEIIYQGNSVKFGENFSSVLKKWKNPIYAGKFDSVYNAFDESYFGIADYKLIFDDAYFFFVEGQLSYFIIESPDFRIELKPENTESEIVDIQVGISVRSLPNTFPKTNSGKKEFKKIHYTLLT